MYCDGCGAEIPSGSSFCPKCGKSVTFSQNVPQNAPYVRSLPPENHLLKAILTLIFCCLPFSIVSLVYACKVEGQWNSGQKDLAVQSSRKANNWANASIWTAIGIYVLYFIFIIGCVIAGVALTDIFDF